MLRKFFSMKFGNVSVHEIFSAVFILGLIPIAILNFYAVFSGRLAGNGNIYYGVISLLYLLFISVFLTLISAAAWKIICELLFLIFRSLEVYIRKNS